MTVYASDLDGVCPSIPAKPAEDLFAILGPLVNPNEAAIAAFVSARCGYCEDAMAALEPLVSGGRKVIRLELEDDRSRLARERFAIGVFPTILLFKGGSLWSMFHGARVTEQFEAWLAHFAPDH